MRPATVLNSDRSLFDIGPTLRMVTFDPDSYPFVLCKSVGQEFRATRRLIAFPHYSSRYISVAEGFSRDTLLFNSAVLPSRKTMQIQRLTAAWSK